VIGAVNPQQVAIRHVEYDATDIRIKTTIKNHKEGNE